MDEYPAWERDMLRCDRDSSERGSILWYCLRLRLELRLCIHHSKLHAAALTKRGFVKLTWEGSS